MTDYTKKYNNMPKRGNERGHSDFHNQTYVNIILTAQINNRVFLSAFFL